MVKAGTMGRRECVGVFVVTLHTVLIGGERNAHSNLLSMLRRGDVLSFHSNLPYILKALGAYESFR